MKKLINDPRSVVEESVHGFGLAHADLVTVSADPDLHHPQGRAGGRQGGPCSPAAAAATNRCTPGFVGLGMLDAAVPGAVFTSPTPDQILPATIAVDSGAGVVHIVKNYTGDVLNFETAGRTGRSRRRSASAPSWSTTTSPWRTRCTRRAGAAWAGPCWWRRSPVRRPSAAMTWTTVAAIGERVNRNVRTMGVALSACTVPHAGTPSFDLADDEIEIGIGIHGEPGRHRIAMENADGITDRLLEPVLSDLKHRLR